MKLIYNGQTFEQIVQKYLLDQYFIKTKTYGLIENKIRN